MILAIVTAFVAGTIVTGTMAYADDDENEILSKILRKLNRIINMIEAHDANSGGGASLTQILTIDKTGLNTIVATSSSEFIVTFCAQNFDDSTFPDSLVISRNNAIIFGVDIDQDSPGDRCITVGGAANDTLSAESSKAGAGATLSTAVMQTSDGATASLT